MTGDVLILTIITIHRNRLYIRAGKVVVAHESEFVPGVDSDPVPDVMSREHVAARAKQSVYRVVIRLDVERDRHLVNVCWDLYLGPSSAAHLG